MKEITEADGKGAFEVHQTILVLKRQMGMAFVELGRLLKIIREESYYQVLGYDTFTSYLVNSELGFEKRTAYYYIEIYELFVERLCYTIEYVAELGYKKLLRLIPIIKLEYGKLPYSKLKEKVEELITDTVHLRPADFEKKYKDDRKQEGHTDFLAPPEYFRCECHSKWRLIVPITDCCPRWLEELEKSLKKIKKKL